MCCCHSHEYSFVTCAFLKKNKQVCCALSEEAFTDFSFSSEAGAPCNRPRRTWRQRSFAFLFAQLHRFKVIGVAVAATVDEPLTLPCRGVVEISIHWISAWSVRLRQETLVYSSIRSLHAHCIKLENHYHRSMLEKVIYFYRATLCVARSLWS